MKCEDSDCTGVHNHLRPSAQQCSTFRARKRVWQSRSLARQIMRGDQIRNVPNHHLGMARLKEWMGNPRPPERELSLIREDSPYVYVVTGQRGHLYLLSTDPMDYGWETHSENTARRRLEA